MLRLQNRILICLQKFTSVDSVLGARLDWSKWDVPKQVIIIGIIYHLGWSQFFKTLHAFLTFIFPMRLLWQNNQSVDFRLLPEESTALTIDLFSSYPPFNRLPLKAIKIYQKYQAYPNKSMHSTLQCWKDMTNRKFSPMQQGNNSNSR